MRHAPVWLCVLALVGLACPSFAFTYHFTELGGLGPYGAYACDINDSVQVVGNSYVSGHGSAFLWQGGTMTTLDPLSGHTFGSAQAINNAGAAAGWTGVDWGHTEGAIWSGGPVLGLGGLGGAIASAEGINEDGDVVGYGQLPGGANAPFAYDSATSTLSLLPSLYPEQACGALDINDSGLVTGFGNADTDVTHAFLWDGSIMVDLGVPDGHAQSYGYAINNLGVIGGWAYTSDYGSHGFLWDNGTWTMVGSGSDRCAIYGLNDAGEAVGYYAPEGEPGFAFLYSGGSIIDLNAYAPANYTLQTGMAINSHGDICGNGLYFDGLEDVDIGWVLVREDGAVPEPGTFALMGLGLAGLLVARRRRQAA